MKNAENKTLSNIDIEQIILMAWADTVSYETIQREWGLSEGALRRFMRTHQSPATYRRWRRRMQARTGRKSKHEAKSGITSRRLKLAV
jgi:uncharacterized protein (TIGR03643 family)